MSDYPRMTVIAPEEEALISQAVRDLANLEHLAQRLGGAAQGAVDFMTELRKARAKFGPMASAHEGYAVILEELDEVWDIVKQKQTARNYYDLRKEVIQLGAMTLAFLVEIVDTENRK